MTNALSQSLRDALSLVESEDRPLLWLLGIGLIATALLETIGIGVVFIFFSVVVSPSNLGGIAFVRRTRAWLGEPDIVHFVLILAAAVFLFLVVRLSMIGATLWLNQNVRNRMVRRVSRRLFQGYMTQPYARHVSTRTSVVINNVVSNSAAAVQNCTLGLLEIVGALSILCSLLIALAVVRPVETLVTTLLVGALVAGYWLFMHQRLSYWGAATVRANEESFRIVGEALRGIKTVKVMRLEPRFNDMFADQVARQTSLTLKYNLAQQAPRLAAELALASILLPLVGLAFWGGQQTQMLVPTLVLFGAAAFRMLPAFVKIVNQMQLFRYSAPALRMVTAEYERQRHQRFDREVAAIAPVKFEKTLQLDSISYRYENTDGPAIDNVTLTIRRGQFVAFAGLSGSGKTTTADVMLGLLEPTSGAMRLDGNPLDSRTALTSGLFGYVPQEPFLTDDTVRHNIALGVPDDKIDARRLEQAVLDSALDKVIAALPTGLDTALGEGGARLSGGERQRLGLARALYLEPRILVLDEPTSALDAITEAEISATLCRLKYHCTIIMIAHRLSITRACDTIFLFSAGRLIDRGSFEELHGRNEEFRTMARLLGIAGTPHSDEELSQIAGGGQ